MITEPIPEPRVTVSSAPQRSARGRALKNSGFLYVCIFAASVSVAILAVLIGSIFIKGFGRLNGVNSASIAGRVVPLSIGREGFIDVPSELISRVGEDLWRVQDASGRIFAFNPDSVERDGETFIHRFPEIDAGFRELGVPPEPPLRFTEEQIVERIGVYEVDEEGLAFEEAWVVQLVDPVHGDSRTYMVGASQARPVASQPGTWTARPRASRPIRFTEADIVERVQAIPTRGSPASEPNGWVQKGSRSLRRLNATDAEMGAGWWQRVRRSTQLGDFLTGYASRNPQEAGFKAALWGSITLCVVCALAAIPLGVATAVALEEFKPRSRVLLPLHNFINLNVGNLAGVPSIVYGILGLTVFVRVFGLLGSPNLSSYDSMLDLGLRSGEELRCSVVREFSHGVVVDDMRSGRRWIPSEDIEWRDEVYVREHSLRMRDGTDVRGGLRSIADGQITLVQRGREPESVRTEEVVEVGGSEIIEFGSRDSFFYLRLPLGGSVLAGGFTLAMVVLPIIIVATRESLRAVPGSIREGAFALGCTRWQMVSRSVLPCAVPGIMTGSILSMSRAIGEAAPLLVIGGFLFIMFTPRNLMDDFAAMPLQIFNWASRPQVEFHQVAAAGIIVLLAVLLAFNLAASLVRHKFQKPLQ